MGLTSFFKNLKKENVELNQDKKDEQVNLSFEQIQKDILFLRNNFGDYDIGETEGFDFIYKNLKDLKRTLIICSLIREGDIPLDAIKDVYGLDDEYINSVIDEDFSGIRAEAYRYLRDVAPNVRYMFFPDVKTHKVELYKEFTDRMDIITEFRRNSKKISEEFGENAFTELLQENIPLLELLNYFNIEESLNIASNLNLLDSFQDEMVQDIYIFDDDKFRELLGSKKILYVKDDLKDKIDRFRNFAEHDELYYGIYLDYDKLIETYTDVIERINQTKEYIFNNKVKKKMYYKIIE